jgi:hypothetical protein
VNNELEWVWKKAVMAFVEISRNLPTELKRTMKNLRITRAPTQIRNGFLPNRRQKS